jgi:hypothetical protein
MTFIPELDGRKELDELFQQFQHYLAQKEKYFKRREEGLDERERELQKREALLTGNAS